MTPFTLTIGHEHIVREFDNIDNIAHPTEVFEWVKSIMIDQGVDPECIESDSVWAIDRDLATLRFWDTENITTHFCKLSRKRP